MKEGQQIRPFVGASVSGQPAGPGMPVDEEVDRQQLQEALHDTRGLLRAVAEAMQDCLFVKDQEGRYVLVNSAAARLLGKSVAEVVGQEDALLLPADQAPRVRAADRRVMEAGEPTTLEDTFPVAGVPRTFLTTKVPYRDLEGVVRGVITIARDITAYRRAEEALRRSEDCYRALFEGNPQPIWVYDRETLALLAVNEAAVQHYGYAREEFLAMRITDIRPPEDAAALRDYLASHPAALSYGREWRHRKKDGTLIHVEVAVHEFLFQGRLSRLVVVNDITERCRLEEQLRHHCCQHV